MLNSMEDVYLQVLDVTLVFELCRCFSGLTHEAGIDSQSTLQKGD